MAERHRLRDLQMGEAGRDAVRMLVGAGEQRRLQGLQPGVDALAGGEDPEAESVAIWSLRERAVWRRPAASPTRALRRDSTDMWISSSARSEEHTSELQSIMRTSYAVVRLK